MHAFLTSWQTALFSLSFFSLQVPFHIALFYWILSIFTSGTLAMNSLHFLIRHPCIEFCRHAGTLQFNPLIFLSSSFLHYSYSPHELRKMEEKTATAEDNADVFIALWGLPRMPCVWPEKKNRKKGCVSAANRWRSGRGQPAVLVVRAEVTEGSQLIHNGLSISVIWVHSRLPLQFCGRFVVYETDGFSPANRLTNRRCVEMGSAVFGFLDT